MRDADAKKMTELNLQRKKPPRSPIFFAPHFLGTVRGAPTPVYTGDKYACMPPPRAPPMFTRLLGTSCCTRACSSPATHISGCQAASDPAEGKRLGRGIRQWPSHRRSLFSFRFAPSSLTGALLLFTHRRPHFSHWPSLFYSHCSRVGKVLGRNSRVGKL